MRERGSLVPMVLLWACGASVPAQDAEPPADAADPDAEVVDAPPTTPPIDAGPPDASPPDASPPDAAPPTAVLAIASGMAHTCAVLDNGAARCWGSGGVGQLGYASTSTIGDDETPAAVGDVAVGSAVRDITAGLAHTCAILHTGAVRCWGHGYLGRLGYGNEAGIGDDETPASAGDIQVGAPVRAIDAGESHTCALLTTGDVKCWGAGYIGQLGYGNTKSIGDDETPATVSPVNVGGAVVQLVTGAEHTCVLLETGAVRCWGLGRFGRLGYGNELAIGDDETPASVEIVRVGAPVVQLAAGAHHTCALLDTGAVRCWGRGASGQLGYGNTEDIGDDELPAEAGDVDVGRRVLQISAWGNHTCVLLDTGAMRCWGLGNDGRLGYGNTSTIGDDETPASAGDVPIGRPVTAIAPGGTRTCALLAGGSVRCWGWGPGALGYGDTRSIGDDETPAAVGDVPLF
jgi:alpha-tubulin suppressor-like RCC1 family protein